MQKLTKAEEKLRVLKSILSGEIDLESLRPPENFYIIQNADGLYIMPGNLNLLYNEEMLQQWLTTVRDCDKVTILKPSAAVPIESGELTYERAAVVDVDYTEVDCTPVETIVDKKPGRKQKRIKTPINEPQDILTEVIPARLIREGKLSEYGETWGSICEY
jgi:hypothetical protein